MGGTDSGVVVMAVDVMNCVELVWSAVVVACGVDVVGGAVGSAVEVVCGFRTAVEVIYITLEVTMEVVCGSVVKVATSLLPRVVKSLSTVFELDVAT